MFLLFCFQVLLFFTISIQVNSLQTMKQHRSQNLDIVKDDVKFSSYSGNPYILACNSSSQCQDTVLDECVIDSPEQNTWYCNCFCDGNGPCKTNRDCCNNNCINEVCTHNGGEQGTVCSGACSTCATNYECQLLPGDVSMGFCDYSDETTIHSMSRTTKNILSSTATKAYDPCSVYNCGPGTCETSTFNSTLPICYCPDCVTGLYCEIDNRNPPNACASLGPNFCPTGTCCDWPCATDPPTCIPCSTSSKMTTMKTTTFASETTTYDSCAIYNCGPGTCETSRSNSTLASCYCPNCFTGAHCETDNRNPPNACALFGPNFCPTGTCCDWPCSTDPPTCIPCSTSSKMTTMKTTTFASETTTYDSCAVYNCGPGTCETSRSNSTLASCYCPDCFTGAHCETDNRNPPNVCASLGPNFCSTGTCCDWPCSTDPPRCIPC